MTLYAGLLSTLSQGSVVLKGKVNATFIFHKAYRFHYAFHFFEVLSDF